MLTNTVSARRTRNITQASEKFASSEKDKYEAWFFLYADFVDSGIKSPATYAVGIAKNPIITTVLPASQSEKVLYAMRNAFKKYGTEAKVISAHAKWCKDNGYEYADISNFKKFAPAGQRAKSDAPKPKVIEREAMKYSVKELEQMLKFRVNAMKK